ncbi:hypothetical protein PHET_10815 [Paragonimus heterotremus]|uniref:Uncharacterized protein n=1 Tax=Paragonimus heterotremus TaxID=100268 RepID=A0A8J4T2A4_9TREM|nr:hypothetical protein PHET_10815 [Paragonimus heterotremus]
MLSTHDLSPPNVKSTRTQPMFVDDCADFRLSLRQPPVFHPKDDFESWEFAVTIQLASVHGRSMGPYTLSFLSEKGGENVPYDGRPPHSPTISHLERAAPLQPETGGIGRQHPERPPKARFKGVQTTDLHQVRAKYLRTVPYGPPKPGPALHIRCQTRRKPVGRFDKGKKLWGPWVVG